MWGKHKWAFDYYQIPWNSVEKTNNKWFKNRAFPSQSVCSIYFYCQTFIQIFVLQFFLHCLSSITCHILLSKCDIQHSRLWFWYQQCVISTTNWTVFTVVTKLTITRLARFMPECLMNCWKKLILFISICTVALQNTRLYYSVGYYVCYCLKRRMALFPVQISMRPLRFKTLV